MSPPPSVSAWHALEMAVAAMRREPATARGVHAVLGEFMAIGTFRDSARGRTVWGYKHTETRRYVFLDEQGGAYTYDATTDVYHPIAPREGIARARQAS